MRKFTLLLPCLLVLGLLSLPQVVVGQQAKSAVELIGSSKSAEPAHVAPAPAQEVETLSLADGARTVAKGTNKFITIDELFRLDRRVRETILNDVDDYNVTPGKISRKDFETLPMTSRANIESHPQIFTIE